MAGSAGLCVWFRLSGFQPVGDQAHASVSVPTSSMTNLQLASGRPVPAAGQPHYSWRVFALKVRECGTASSRALPFPWDKPFFHWCFCSSGSTPLCQNDPRQVTRSQMLLFPGAMDQSRSLGRAPSSFSLRSRPYSTVLAIPSPYHYHHTALRAKVGNSTRSLL